MITALQGPHEEDAITYDRLEKILSKLPGSQAKFDETALFKGENANVRRHVDGFHEFNLTYFAQVLKE